VISIELKELTAHLLQILKIPKSQMRVHVRVFNLSLEQLVICTDHRSYGTDSE